MKEMKILNRIVRIDHEGLAYEADPRHVELLVKSLGLEDCKFSSTPGTTEHDLRGEGLLEIPCRQLKQIKPAIDSNRPAI